MCVLSPQTGPSSWWPIHHGDLLSHIYTCWQVLLISNPSSNSFYILAIDDGNSAFPKKLVVSPFMNRADWKTRNPFFRKKMGFWYLVLVWTKPSPYEFCCGRHKRLKGSGPVIKVFGWSRFYSSSAWFRSRALNLGLLFQWMPSILSLLRLVSMSTYRDAPGSG